MQNLPIFPAFNAIFARRYRVKFPRFAVENSQWAYWVMQEGFGADLAAQDACYAAMDRTTDYLDY